MNTIKQLTDLILEYNFEEINYITFPINTKFGLIINYGNVKYEFIMNIKEDSDKLIVLGAGNIPPSSLHKFKGRPVFSRISWPLKESTIFYNDPSRSMGKTELGGGYGLGTVKHWCVQKISEIIERIADRLFEYNSPEEAHNNIIFFGSSMGGFMSLQLAIFIKNSIAITEMPLIDVTQSLNWPRLEKNLFPGMTLDEIRDKYNYKLDIVELMKREKYIPDCYLVLDCSVDYDYEHQYKKLFDRLMTYLILRIMM